ncbi:MAG: type 1 glutamine amidotransferase [Nitriliruptorales bacterium]
MTEPEEYDYGELLVIQHAEHTGPAALTEVLDTRAGRRPWRLVDLGAGAPFPSLDRVRGIVVLGGPMGVRDREEHPWIDAEIAAIQEAQEHEIPLFGICLGVQLLGEALNGRVETRDLPEIGLIALTRTEAGSADPVFAGWPDGASALFLHDDEVVALPDGAEPMLEGSDGVAAWRSPDGVSYGAQFHPEVDAAQAAAWLAREDNRERFARVGVDPDDFVEETRRRERFLLAAGLSLVGRWIDAVVGRNDPDPVRGRRAGSASRRS